VSDCQETRTLTRCETPCFARRKFAEFHWSKLSSYQSLDTEPKRRAQSTDFSLSPFGDRHLELPPISAKPACLDARWMHWTIVEGHAFTRSVNSFFRLAEHSRDIRPFDFAARMRQTMCRFAVGCEE
jgi:hypothetical protein